MNPCIRSAVSAFTLILTLGACGTEGCAPTGPARGTEQITTGGIAFIVDQHLGPDNVGEYGANEPEEDSVGVLVRLRGAPRRDAVP